MSQRHVRSWIFYPSLPNYMTVLGHEKAVSDVGGGKRSYLRDKFRHPFQYEKGAPIVKKQDGGRWFQYGIVWEDQESWGKNADL